MWRQIDWPLREPGRETRDERGTSDKVARDYRIKYTKGTNNVHQDVIPCARLALSDRELEAVEALGPWEKKKPRRLTKYNKS